MIDILQNLIRKLPRWLQLLLLVTVTIGLLVLCLAYFGRWWQVMIG